MSLGDRPELSPKCDSALLADGEWHHLAGTLTNASVGSMYLDFEPLGEAMTLTDTALSGNEARGSLLGWHRAGFDLWGLNKGSDFAIHCSTSAPDEGADSPCMQRIRSFVEAQPWLNRRGGWDHIVLFGGADYPRKFDPIHPSADEDFVLEISWPAFKNFVLLHLGTRTERCLAHFSDPRTHTAEEKLSFGDCQRRVFQTITIPPFFQDEDFDCTKLANHVETPRSHRLAYRGLAYSAMIERNAVHAASSEANLNSLQVSGAFRLEFTNWSHELLQMGVCRPSFAFDGLCPWSAVGRARDPEVGNSRVKGMKQRAKELWAQAEMGLVLPGDGGYELRLYSMLDKGTVPVIAFHRGVAFPKIPFPSLLPWHKFAFFWDLGRQRELLGFADDMSDRHADINPVATAHQLLKQLAVLDPKVVEKKRRALLRHAPSLGWTDRISCKRRNQRTALDLLAGELAHRLTRHKHTGSTLIPWLDWGWKVPDGHLAMTEVEDVTGTGCPFGYPICSIQKDGGHICTAFWPGTPFTCPIGCKRSANPPLCRMPWGAPCVLPDQSAVQKGTTPCGLVPPSRHPDDVLPNHWGMIRRPRIALITWSDRPELSSLTRPSLERFCQEHPGRYDLIVEQEPLLDPSRYALAWNKLAFMRRVLVTNLYDAVLWIDDDILITEPTHDPIFEGLSKSLVKLHNDSFLYASRDVRVDDRVPMNTGILAMRSGRRALRLIKELFDISKRPEVLDNQVFVTSHQGWWEQDAMAVWMRTAPEPELIHLEDHRQIQSFVRDCKQESDSNRWQPGDFSAHFTGFRNQASRLATVKCFLREQRLRGRMGDVL
eukprot:TRINITY_DN61514_c0_g1_i1.p1 TRINITY_DN61514_c0_g1~~TRINITY_DN61514_c0_g1_i1.p1  ORF type:complete len:827 (-),score=124.24 TRINITY_DN61514_c0_g1_i1:61-2541(-)